MFSAPHKLSTLSCITAAFLLNAGPALARDGASAPQPIRVLPGGWQRADLLSVKFKDGLTIRLRDGQLSDLGRGDLAKDAAALAADFAGCRWERAYAGVTEEKLAQMRRTAIQNLGKNVADQNLQFNLWLPETVDAMQAVKRLHALAIVEWAAPFDMPLPAPNPPDFTNMQTYSSPTPNGIGKDQVYRWPGGTGLGLSFCDIEYSFNANHQDFTAVTRLGPAPTDPFNDNNHGTAVFGEIISVTNYWGTSGLAEFATPFFAAVNTNNVQNIAAAVNIAAVNLALGDVILIEQQVRGPRYTGVPAGTQFGLVAVDWDQAVYNAVVTAVGNGIVVVEAGGNGSQNLDDAVYNVNQRPFTAAGDSGSIIVGAGASPNGSAPARTRLGFSSFGSTVDLQGWGENVATTGYGTLYGVEGANLFYRGDFNGTSSATPIVASAAILLESVYKAVIGGVLTPAQVKAYLQQTGAAQTGGGNIGPFPDVKAAIAAALGNNDCNGNGTPDAIDLRLPGGSRDNNGDGIPDECQGGGGPPNDGCAPPYIIIPDNAQVPATLAGATFNPADGVSTCFPAGTPDVFFVYVPTCTGTATIASAAPVGLAVHALCPAMPGNQIACALPGPAGAQVTFNVVQGQFYFVRVAAVPGMVIPPMFPIGATCVPAPPNDQCAAAMPIGEGAFPFTTIGATTDGPAAACSPLNNDIWWTYHPSCTGTASVSVCRQAFFDTALVVYGGQGCVGPVLACGHAAQHCPPSMVGTVVQFPASAGGVYTIRLGGTAAGVTGMGQLTVACLPVIGACCTGTTCSVIEQTQCGGSFEGANTFCTPSTCCASDINLSGGLSVQDIFDFLALYFSGDPRADINHSGVLSVQDIFDFLAAYFAGCP